MLLILLSSSYKKVPSPPKSLHYIKKVPSSHNTQGIISHVPPIILLLVLYNSFFKYIYIATS